MTVALVTDSNSQLPAELRERFRVHVVALTVVLDGTPYREGIEITTAESYDHLARGADVSTAAPSPGEVAAVYDAAVAAGATEILSIHVGSNTSGTIHAVRLAAGGAAVPVEVVDTGTASFAISCCVWAAADVLAAGGSVAAAAGAARAAATVVDNVFVVGALDLARRGGRLATSVDEQPGDVPVLALVDGRIEAVGRVGDIDAAVTAMTEYVVGRAAGAPIRVGVGDALTPALAAEFAAALRARPEVTDLVHYEIGPTVGAHTGPGTVGACFFRG